jgi:replicative DNA helicase
MVIAGRPGAGKTALMVSIAKKVAEQNKQVVIFSLEMVRKQIAMRLIAMESGITYGSQKSGKLQDNEWPFYTQAVEKLSSIDDGIVLNDLPAITISQMRRELRRLWIEKPADLVIVDYIQLQGADGDFERRDLQIGEITRGIKSLCKEFNVPIIAGAQMSRDIEKRAEKRPVLSDLRESGSIENDADIVAFIHRPDKLGNTAELIFEKNRNGECGVVDLIYHGARTRFDSATSMTFNPNK